MINFLPIKSIREEDKELFGENIIKLARLSHHNLPVGEGLAVAPPLEQIENIFSGLNISAKEEFESNKEKFSAKFFKILPPEGFLEEISNKRIDSGQVWQNVLKSWFNLLESKIFREGYDKKHLSSLPGQVVLFATDISASGRAFYDRFKKEVLVRMEEGELKFEDGLKVDQIIIAAERILHLPYIYSFVIDSGEMKITKVSPFTDKKVFETELKSVNPKPKLSLKVNLNKRAVKLFLEVGKGFVSDPEVDGFILNGGVKEDFDLRAFRLSELAASFQAHPVIYSFGEVDRSEDGSYRDTLEEEAKVFLFARHKKKLLNTQIALPPVNSVESLMQIKRDLSSLGVLRKASLKFWMKAATPENLIQIENYITGGFDGIIIDLDGINKNLSGGEKRVSSSVVEMLEKFIEEPLKILHKAQIPVIVTGRIALDHQLLERLVNMGVYGIVIDSDESVYTRDNIKELEQGHQNLVP